MPCPHHNGVEAGNGFPADTLLAMEAAAGSAASGKIEGAAAPKVIRAARLTDPGLVVVGWDT